VWDSETSDVVIRGGERQMPHTHISDNLPCMDRRIYVHDEAFRCGCDRASSEWTDELVPALAACQAWRIAYHHVSGATEIGMVDQDAARAVLRELRPRLMDVLDRALRNTGVRAINSGREGNRITRMLREDESINATCFDSGYWTFATGSEAAERMYGDHEPLRQLASRVANGDGPEDLTLLRGNSVCYPCSTSAVRDMEPWARWPWTPPSSEEWQQSVRAHRRAVGETVYLVITEHPWQGTKPVDQRRLGADVYRAIAGRSLTSGMEAGRQDA